MKKSQRLFRLPDIYYILDKKHLSDVCGYNFQNSKIISFVEPENRHVWLNKEDFEKRCTLYRVKLK